MIAKRSIRGIPKLAVVSMLCLSTLFAGAVVSSVSNAATVDESQVAPEKHADSHTNPRAASTSAPRASDCKLEDCLHGREISWSRTLALALSLCIAYWLALVAVRWNRIAHPTREMLRAQIASLSKELTLLANPAGTPVLQELLMEAGKLVNGDGLSAVTWADVVFWSRGKELTGWGYVHEVEAQMVPYLPLPTVVAKLEVAEHKLTAANDAGSSALAKSINDALTATPRAGDDRLRALLSEALQANYEREDNSFADLLSWQNKTAWLISVGLLLILVLVGIYPRHSELLLIGAVGGLISRLSRSLERKDVPTDYGASWTTLFLSPVAGALGAWAGVLVADLAFNLSVLGTVFKGIWDVPLNNTALGAALVFGFSERLLDTVLDKAAEKIGGTQSPSSPPPSGGKTAPPPAAPPADAAPGAGAPPAGPAPAGAAAPGAGGAAGAAPVPGAPGAAAPPVPGGG
jgi:hypothetical protein